MQAEQQRIEAMLKLQAKQNRKRKAYGMDQLTTELLEGGSSEEERIRDEPSDEEGNIGAIKAKYKTKKLKTLEEEEEGEKKILKAKSSTDEDASKKTWKKKWAEE